MNNCEHLSDSFSYICCNPDCPCCPSFCPYDEPTKDCRFYEEKQMDGERKENDITNCRQKLKEFADD